MIVLATTPENNSKYGCAFHFSPRCFLGKSDVLGAFHLDKSFGILYILKLLYRSQLFNSIFKTLCEVVDGFLLGWNVRMMSIICKPGSPLSGCDQSSRFCPHLITNGMVMLMMITAWQYLIPYLAICARRMKITVLKSEKSKVHLGSN